MPLAPAPDAATMSSQLRETLRERLLSGDLPPGGRINLDRLRQQTGVSLSPLREALARLEGEGLVEFHDNRGFRAAPIGPESLDEIAALQADLLPRALGDAIARGDLAWEAEVLGALHRLTRCPPDPRPGWEAAQRDLMARLIAGRGQPMLVALCTRLAAQEERYRRLLLPAPADPAAAIAALADLAHAAVARDTAAARAALGRHGARTQAALRAALALRADASA
ncbi:MAG: GntR family transcriptional regulator [Rhodobacterales bacterium]|nr:GntR family transcriptional regulator [Rhodobacterales bacterium]